MQHKDPLPEMRDEVPEGWGIQTCCNGTGGEVETAMAHIRNLFSPHRWYSVFSVAVLHCLAMKRDQYQANFTTT
jgi:hypothetical protein